MLIFLSPKLRDSAVPVAVALCSDAPSSPVAVVVVSVL